MYLDQGNPGRTGGTKLRITGVSPSAELPLIDELPKG